MDWQLLWQGFSSGVGTYGVSSSSSVISHHMDLAQVLLLFSGVHVSGKARGDLG